MNELRSSAHPRNGTADLLKGFAVLFMIQVHITEQFASPEVLDSLIGKVSLFLGGPFCAPVFLAVMGYFMASGKKPAIHFLKRGIILFTGGILLNATRSANLLIHISKTETGLNPWNFLLGVDILPLAGISLIIAAILKTLLKDKGILYLILAIGVAGVSPVLQDSSGGQSLSAHFRAFFTGTYEWSYFPVFPWLSYILTGMAYRFLSAGSSGLPKTEHQWLYAAGIVVFLTVTAGFAISRITILEGPEGYYHHGISLYLWMVLFILLYAWLMNRLRIRWGTSAIMKFVQWMGKNVTMIYVIQWLIIGNLAREIYRTQGLFASTGWFATIFMATMALTSLVLYLRGSVFTGSKSMA